MNNKKIRFKRTLALEEVVGITPYMGCEINGMCANLFKSASSSITKNGQTTTIPIPLNPCYGNFKPFIPYVHPYERQANEADESRKCEIIISLVKKIWEDNTLTKDEQTAKITKIVGDNPNFGIVDKIPDNLKRKYTEI